MVPTGLHFKRSTIGCIKNEFVKAVLLNCWEDYLDNTVTDISQKELGVEKFKLTSSSRQDVHN